jgi:hypothetical protein
VQLLQRFHSLPFERIGNIVLFYRGMGGYFTQIFFPWNSYFLGKCNCAMWTNTKKHRKYYVEEGIQMTLYLRCNIDKTTATIDIVENGKSNNWTIA